MEDKMVDILIVEDSDDDYEATLRALSLPAAIEQRVVRCRDGAEAWTTLNTGQSKDVDGSEESRLFIIMDLNMPGLDGRALLSKIKTHDQLKSIPVAILTTSDDPADIQECYQNGANTFVKKPVNWSVFATQMETLKAFWLNSATLPFRL